MIRVGHVSMGPRTTIGPRNNIRGLAELRMAEDSNIATRNSITAFPKAAELSQDVFPHSPNREPVLILGVGAKVTDNHEIDCSDRVELGRHAALAGFASQVLTHSLNLVTDRQTTGAVVLGDHCAVMSGCILQSGTNVPARAIISAGSVVTTRLTTEQALYRGNPAELVRELPDHLAYFHRGEDRRKTRWKKQATATVEAGMSSGVYVVLGAVLVALVAGGALALRNGRFRGTHAVRGAGAAAGAPPASVLDGSPWEGQLGERATLLQFSSAFCAPCRSTRRILSDIAGSGAGGQPRRGRRRAPPRRRTPAEHPAHADDPGAGRRRARGGPGLGGAHQGAGLRRSGRGPTLTLP